MERENKKRKLYYIPNLRERAANKELNRIRAADMWWMITKEHKYRGPKGTGSYLYQMFSLFYRQDPLHFIEWCDESEVNDPEFFNERK